MASASDRAVLPIPDQPYEGLVTYDAKDPDSASRRSSRCARRRAWGRVESTVPAVFSADETLDLGRDSANPVSDDHGAANAFNGRVGWVQIDLDEAAEDVDHLISPEERLRIAMARQ
jgi:ABC-type hemin transport system ATPase subunit